MKTRTLFPLIFLALLMACVSCQNSDIVSEDAPIVEEMPFTLTATYGSDDTRIALDDDGLGLNWVPGDCLYLVDVTGKNKTVKMTTSITEPTKKASFKSSSSVLSGAYIVLSGANALTFDPYTTLSNNSNLQSYIVLYGNLTVTEGQTSASITLSHVFPKLKFTFRNIPYDITDPVFGMAVGKHGMSVGGKIQQTGYDVYDTTNGTSNGAFVLKLGTNLVSGQSALVYPADYSGSKVFFYLHGTASDGSHVTYEIAKNGINLQAGNNYNITLDFSTAAKSTIIGKVLKNTADFRAAAYWKNTKNSYTVSSDIDFSGETVIPILCNSLDGQNHVLKNIDIDYDKCNFVGLVSQGNVKNIAVLNASVKGRGYVGCATGYGYVQKCIAKESAVYGTGNYVGGLIGYSENNSSSQSGFEGDVTGLGNYVGGIVGCSTISSTYKINRCYSRGKVTGKNCVGGISGEGYISESYFIGDVTGTGTSAAGINGSGTCYYCYSYGNISSGIGISYSSVYDCLTSCSKLKNSGSDSDYCNCGPSKTFLSLLSVINRNEAYSTQVWKDIDAQCPLLQWQSDALNGDIIVPGYNDINW